MPLIRYLLPLLLFLAALPLRAEEPLDPEQAYKFSARALDANTLEARWQIADGYYMYREKIRFTAAPDSIKLGEPRFPAGEVKDDEFFGRVETYRRDLRIRIPVEAGGADSLVLKANSQGCWDQGVCYPPTPQQATVKLLPTSSPAGSAPAASEPPPAPDATPAREPTPAGQDDESSRIARILSHGGFWLAIASFYGFGLLLCLTPCVFPMVPILSGIIVNHGHAVTHGRAFALSPSPCSVSTSCSCRQACRAGSRIEPTARAAAMGPLPSWAPCRP